MPHRSEPLRPFANGDASSPAMMKLCAPAFVFLLSVAVSCISCGGVVSDPPAPATVSVTPSSAQPFTGGTVQFVADVQSTSGASGFNWMVNQVSGGNSTVGTVNSSGLYIAPTVVPNPATVIVTAVWQADTTKSGSSNVTIQGLSAIQGPLSLAPALTSLTTTQTLQMQVLTAGLSNTMVKWSVDGVAGGNPAIGTITPSGTYNPPNTAGSHLIIAAAQSNPNAIGSAQVEVTDFPGTFTWRNDNSRSGLNQQEWALATPTVNSATFGKLFSCPLDGYGYAQPLYVANLPIPGNGTHNVVFVATENDSVFAFDADASPCVQLWQTSLIPAGSAAVQTPNLQITSGDIAPLLGITGTPVISMSTSALYVVAETSTAGTNPTYSQLLYALDLATGQPKIQPAGVEIGASISGSPTFSPLLENQRAALLLDNNDVYVAFGSHGGEGNYHGWLLGYDSTTLQQTSYFVSTADTLQGGGIWQAGGGPAADSNNNVYVITGDGPFDAYRGGASYSDSFLRLGTSAKLAVADYFTPCNQVSLSTAGLDVGASAPLLLPDSAGSASQPHLMIGASKAGSLYVVNRDNLGGYNAACPDTSPRVQTVPVSAEPIMSTPAFWNDAVYVASGGAPLMAFPVTAGVLASLPLPSQSPEVLGPYGATPAVSSKGGGNGIIWLIDSSGALATPNSPAILRAFDPNNLSNEIYNSAMLPARDSAGLAVKFTVPTVANAKVYVGAQAELDVYGLLN